MSWSTRDGVRTARETAAQSDWLALTAQLSRALGSYSKPV